MEFSLISAHKSFQKFDQEEEFRVASDMKIKCLFFQWMVANMEEIFVQ